MFPLNYGLTERGPRMKRTVMSLMVVVLMTAGCSAPLLGAGKVGLGYSSSSEVYLFHTTDGDKQDNTAKAELNLDPLLRNYREYKEVTPDSDDE